MKAYLTFTLGENEKACKNKKKKAKISSEKKSASFVYLMKVDTLRSPNVIFANGAFVRETDSFS